MSSSWLIFANLASFALKDHDNWYWTTSRHPCGGLSQWRRVHGLTAKRLIAGEPDAFFPGFDHRLCPHHRRAYVVDNMNSGPGARPMVNWDVVAKNIDGVVAPRPDGWKKIAG